jgi:hypothetical protein
MEPSYPATLKVGLYSVNGCTEAMSARFEDFNFTAGKAAAPAAARIKVKAKERQR